MRLATKLIPLLRSAGLTPGSHPLLALTRLRQPFLVDALNAPIASPGEAQSALDEAIRGATSVCAGIDALLDSGHPVRAVARAELGKLLAADEPMPVSSVSTADETTRYPPSGAQRLLLAKKILGEAHAELLIAFGKDSGGVVGREVRELTMRLEREIGVLQVGLRNVRERG
jgi:hypothetical protein